MFATLILLLLLLLATPWSSPTASTRPSRDPHRDRVLFRSWVSSAGCLCDLVQGIGFGTLAAHLVKTRSVKDSIAIIIPCIALGLLLHARRKVINLGWTFCNPLGWSCGLLYGLLWLSGGWWVPLLAIGFSLGAQTLRLLGPLTIISNIGHLYVYPLDQNLSILATLPVLLIGLNWWLDTKKKPLYLTH